MGLRSAFVAPLAWCSRLAPPPGELVSIDGSSTYWEVGKLVAQALRADPNTLETIFVDGARATDEMGQGCWAVGAGPFGSLSRNRSMSRTAGEPGGP